MAFTKRRWVIWATCLIVFALVISIAQDSPVRAVGIPKSPSSSPFAIGTYNSSPALAIPDSPDTETCNITAGTAATTVITVPDIGTINDVNLNLDITHSFIGDLVVTLTSPGGTTVTVIELISNGSAPGAGGCGCPGANIVTGLDDSSANGSIEAACPPALANYVPFGGLNAFNGENLAGNWTLSVVDWSGLGTGTVNTWGLVIDYTVPSTTLAATAACNGDNLHVTVTSGDGETFDITGTGPGLPTTGAIGTTSLGGPGDWTGVTVAETAPNNETLLLGNFSCGDGGGGEEEPAPIPEPPSVPGVPVPNLGQILIDLSRTQVAYQEPNGEPIAGIVLPSDFDGNGFDTYTITSIVVVDREYWLGLFIGSANWGWVRLDDVVQITDLNLPPLDVEDDGGGDSK